MTKDVTKRSGKKEGEGKTGAANDDKKIVDKNKKPKTPKYGPMPTFPHQKVWTRGVLIFSLMAYIWYTSKTGKEVSLARQKETLQQRGQTVQCDRAYLEEVQSFRGCFPKSCGRYVSDKLVTASEAETLLQVAKKGLSLGGSDGGASILDLHSGALSYGKKFINVHTLDSFKKILTPADLAVYKIVKTKIQRAIAEIFNVDVTSLHLTHPTFFSRLTNLQPKTEHDEYWHIHVDKVTYESFHYTSLLYLSDHRIDFKGGRLVFVDGNVDKPSQNVTVEPRKGRVAMFTSGSENPHYVEKVTDGTRYAITVSFTCDVSKAINDPTIR